MAWNWQQPAWPEFTYDPAALEGLERQFLLRSGAFIGALKHVGDEDQDALKIEVIGEEALKTSEIAGGILGRETVQSSFRQPFERSGDRRRAPPSEPGDPAMRCDA